MENNFIYFIPESIVFFGIILSVAINFRIKDKKPTWGNFQNPKKYLILLNIILFLALLGFLPFFVDFLKLSGLSGFFTSFSFTPYEDFTKTLLGGSLSITPLNILFKFLIVSSAFITSLISLSFVKTLNQRVVYFSTLLLFIVLGGLFLSSSNDVLSLFISAEIISVALCFLIANFSYKKEKVSCNKNCAADGPQEIFGAPLEASVKYFITSATASCFMLFAAGYIYLHLGTLNFSDIGTLAINKLLPQNPLLNAAEVIFFLGLVFKTGGFPFYLWVMDVFKGLNHSTGLLISTTIETAGFIALIKAALALGFFGSVLSFTLLLCAVLTLVLGHLFTFRIVKKEGSINDFLSANTIASTGYIFLGISFLTSGTIKAAIFYLLVYLIMSFGLWAGFGLVLKNLRKNTQKNTKVLSSIRGLAYISPAFTMAFTLCLLSFAGLPLMAGFSARFYLYTEILRCGVWTVYPLLFAAFASILAIYFYFKIIYFMFSKPESLKIFKKNTIYNKTNICTFVLMFSAALLFIMFFVSAPVIQILNKIV